MSRRLQRFRRFVPWSIALVCWWSSPIHAQAPLNDQGFAFELQAHLLGRNYKAALELLESRPDVAGSPEGVRLRAELLFQTGRADEALNLLERRLADSRSDSLARFQVAEIHFELKRDRAATLAYRLALAGDLEDFRRQVSLQRLRQIDDRRTWRFDAGLAVAPDSNLNGGAAASTINLFGLPFELSDEARRQSGVTLSGEGSMSRQWRLSARDRLEAGLAASVVQPSDERFDQTRATAYVQIAHRIDDRSTAFLSASSQRSWIDGEAFEQRHAAAFTFEVLSANNVHWLARSEFGVRQSPFGEVQDGHDATLQATRTKYLGPTSFWRTTAALSDIDLKAQALSYQRVSISAGRLYALPSAVTAYMEPYAAHRRFKAVSPFFGVQRRDVEYGLNVRLAKRDWNVFGAFPFVQLNFLRSTSNVALGEFGRERVELGVTREF